ncbi:HSFY1 protein, partial [Odontophorus gujanensis]|nr:HSFY1 protein [Odontophorus gujanensis]
MEEQDSEMVLVEDDTKDLCLSSSEESTGQASVFTSLSFPQKLWVLAESGDVKSVWWGLGGNCLVIEEELFLVEVLAKEGSVRVFGCTSMKSFVRQLNNYGFTKVPRNVERFPSLHEFLPEEEVLASKRKLLLYSSPYFRRDFPYLLQHCKRRAARKRRAVDATAPAPGLQEAQNESAQRSSPGAHPMQDAVAGPERSLQAAEPAGTQAVALVGPLPAKRPKEDSPRAQKGTPHTLPGPAAAPVPEQCRALPCFSQMLGATRAPTAHGAQPFVMPTLTPGPSQQELPQAPETAQLQAPWDALSFLCTSFAMAMVSLDCQPWAALHCPTCTCCQHQAAPHCPMCTCCQNREDAGP